MSSKICFMLLQISSNLFLPKFIKNNFFICKSCQDDPNIVIMPLNIIIIGHCSWCYIFYGLPALTTTAKIIILPLYSMIMPCKILIMLLNSIITLLHIIIMQLNSIIMQHNIIIMLLNILII